MNANEPLTVTPPAGSADGAKPVSEPRALIAVARPVDPVASGETAAQRPPKVVAGVEKGFLYGVLVLFVLAVGVMQAVVAWRQADKYRDAVSFLEFQSLTGGISEGNFVTFLAAALPAEDVIFLRHATIFLGFIVIVLGAMFVLTGIEVAYRLGVQRGESHATLKTTSPGLVLITFGLVLVLGGLYRSTTVEVKAGTPAFATKDTAPDEVARVLPEAPQPKSDAPAPTREIAYPADDDATNVERSLDQ